MKRAFSDNEIRIFLDDIIGKNPKFNQQKILESVYLLEIDKNLKNIVPTALADHIHAFKYAAGKLYISTDHGIYGQQMQLYKDKILADLQQKVTPDLQKIEIRVGKIYYKKYKTDDIMSRNEKMAHNLRIDPTNESDSKIIDQLISAVRKILH